MEPITINKVAEASGVSKTTVSKYLNGGNVRPEYRVRVEETLKKMNYCPNLIAKALKTRKTYTIGILIPYINDLFSSEIVANMESLFQKRGYGILVCGYEGRKDFFRTKLDFLIGKMIDAVVVFPSGLSSEDFHSAQTYNVPICLIDREIEGVLSDVVMTDNEKAGYVATKYLINHGHSAISFITGSDLSYTSKRRNMGIIRALKEMKVDMSKIKFVYCYNSDDITERVKDIVSVKKVDRPSVIFATNFYLTYKTIKALNYLNQNIPEDISLLAFDNVDVYNIYSKPLTIVAQSTDMISENAVCIILERIEKPDSEKIIQKLDVSIIEGKSVKNLL